jgi:hypothetical protein
MPLPNDPPPFLTDEPVRTGPLLFLRSISRVLGRSPLWLVPTLLMAGLAMPIGLAMHAFFSDTIGYRYQPDALEAHLTQVPGEAAIDPAYPESMPDILFEWDDLVGTLTASFKHDNREGLRALKIENSNIGAALVLLVMLAGVFVAGGWLQVILERTHGRTFRRFCMGGGRYFFRFLRVFGLLLVLLAGWNWLTYGPPWERYVLEGWLGLSKGDGGYMEALDSEFTVRALGWGQAGLHVLGVALLLAWATYVRTRLALHDSRSVLKAGLLTVWTLVRHPLRTLTPLVLLALVQVLVVSLALGAFRKWLEGGLLARPSTGLVFAMAIVSFVALALREVLRGARYHAAVKVSQTIVRPPQRVPDPWKSIGGPGGPQYPVGDGGEEYVAM